jgi:RNA polymerase sigma-70 factor (ECF subfamily)
LRALQRTAIEVPTMGTEEDPLELDRYRGYLTALARLQLAARPWLAGKLDASELVQMTFLKAHAGRAGFRGRTAGEFVAWLRTIFNRALANELRALGREKRRVGAERSLDADLDASSCRLDAWLAVDQTSPSEAVARGERAATLAGAVEGLPPDQREVVLLKHCQGLTLQEIAEQTERTVAAVAGLLRRGLAQLRECLDEGTDL